MTNQLPPPLPPEPAPRSTARSTSRRLLAAGVGAGLLAGGALGFAAGVPSLTSAAAPTVVDEPIEQSDDTDEREIGRQATGERLREHLQTLVDDGTIDSSQADAVSAYLADEWNERPGRPGGPGHRAHPRLESIDTAVEILGIDAETVRDELRSGSSLADLAEANGVDPQTLIDALVAEHEERVTARVNGERPD